MKEGGTCPEMCGVSTRADRQAQTTSGELQGLGRGHSTRELRKLGCLRQLSTAEGGGATYRTGDLSSCHPPHLETACHSPEALLSKGVRLRKDWQSGLDERGVKHPG